MRWPLAAQHVYSTLANYTLTANVERGTINTTAAANLTGNGWATSCMPAAGNNVLDGAGGIDLVSYASASAGVTINLAVAGAQTTGGSGSDTLISIESLFGSVQRQPDRQRGRQQPARPRGRRYAGRRPAPTQ